MPPPHRKWLTAKQNKNEARIRFLVEDAKEIYKRGLPFQPYWKHKRLQLISTTISIAA